MNHTKKTEDKALQCGPLEHLFNKTTPARILDFLSTYKSWDYSKQDIAKYSGVSPRHAIREIDKLEYLGLIIKTRNVGHCHMYQYNTKSEAAKLIDQLGNTLAFEENQRILERDALEEDAEAEAKDPAQQQTETQPETETEDEAELLTAPS